MYQFKERLKILCFQAQNQMRSVETQDSVGSSPIISFIEPPVRDFPPLREKANHYFERERPILKIYISRYILAFAKHVIQANYEERKFMANILWPANLIT